MASCRKAIGLLDTYYRMDPRFECQPTGTEEQAPKSYPGITVTIADCVLFSLLQFAYVVYGVELFAEFPHVEEFYRWFEMRDSARLEGMLEDENVKLLASHWIKERSSWAGRAWESLRVFSTYLAFMGRSIAKVLFGKKQK
ncbi:hypothetical protein LTR84_007109 [Exophiala bonariae]|uniref:GST C-terminal domain-containing protein n=1 Tax=Exophiala bonariae TaxID=1690606 RepID=A0AAV9MZP7_9EURO|nr:hypothetical protein LTR84_007109 [Exophiala bonariae]